MQLLLKTLNEEPPSLPKEPWWDEHFEDFISYCLAKDPKQRKSAEEIMKECKAFFSKAKGKDYIKEKLLRGSEVDIKDENNPEAVSTGEIVEKKCGRRCHAIEFNFAVGEDESGSQENGKLVSMGAMVNQQDFSKKVLTKKCVSNPSCPTKKILDFKVKEIPPYRERSVFHLQCSKLLHMKQSDHLVVSNGDRDGDFYFLNEEEN
jgi:serine/threonine protein kinase